MEDFSKRNYRRGNPGKEDKGEEEAGCLQGTATLIMQTYKRTHQLVLGETVAFRVVCISKVLSNYCSSCSPN